MESLNSEKAYYQSEHRSSAVKPHNQQTNVTTPDYKKSDPPLTFYQDQDTQAYDLHVT